MAIKVIAQRRVLKIGKNPGAKRFVMRPDLYIPIQEKKVFAEASTPMKPFCRSYPLLSQQVGEDFGELFGIGLFSS